MICDRTDKNNFLRQNRMLKFFIRQRMIDDEVHENVTFKPSTRLEKYLSFDTQKRNEAANDFGRDL